MEPILALPPEQFRAALAELQLDPAREAALIDAYNQANAPQEGAGRRGMMYNLLDNIIGYDDDIVTPGERLGAGVQQFASGLLSDPLGTGADIVRGGYETIERAMAPGATPMDVMGAAGMAMGAGLLGAAPQGSLRIFAGRNARTADMSALRRAERMAEQGADRETIWNETGWFQGADGQWRFEIDDSGSQVRPEAARTQEYMPLREGFSHLALANAYPDMFLPTGIAYRYTDTPDVGGTYNFDTQDLNVRAPQEADMGQARDITIHELQHAVQRREGFAPGTNQSAAFDSILSVRRQVQDQLERQMDERQAQLGLEGYLPTTNDPELLDLQSRFNSAVNTAITDDDVYDLYSRAAGEVEARNAQQRAGMSASQRRQTPPWVTQDIADADQFLNINTDPLANLRAYIAQNGLLSQ